MYFNIVYFLNLVYFFLNVFSVYYVFTDNEKYNVTLYGDVINTNNFYLKLFILIVLSNVFLVIRKVYLKDDKLEGLFNELGFELSSLVIKLIMFTIQVILFIVCLIFFYGVNKIFINIFLIENNIYNIDGKIFLNGGYVIERIYSDQEKMFYAEECLRILNDTYTGVDYSLSISEKNKITDLKTLGDVKEYIRILFQEYLDSIILKEEEIKSSSNEYGFTYYITHRYTIYAVTTILAIGLFFIGYRSMNTKSNELLSATKNYTDQITKESKEAIANSANISANASKNFDKNSEFGTTLMESVVSNSNSIKDLSETVKKLDNTTITDSVINNSNTIKMLCSTVEDLSSVIEDLNKSSNNNLNKNALELLNNKDLLSTLELLKTKGTEPTEALFGIPYVLRSVITYLSSNTEYELPIFNDDNSNNNDFKPFEGNGKKLGDS